MKNEAIEIADQTQVITSEALLDHWQGHRRLTRKMIEAFPEDQLFTFSIGGMRPFSELILEMTSLSAEGVKGIVTGTWAAMDDMDYNAGKSRFQTKSDLLGRWDEVTEIINSYWEQITPQKFREVMLMFGLYEGEVSGMILYWIDNEIHHRGQGYVYLRALGIEPPAFWDRY